MEFNPGEMSSGATSPLWVLWVLPWYGLLGAEGLKAAGSIVVLVAVLAAYRQALRMGTSVWGALLPSVVVAYCVAPAGFLGYEAPLAALASIAWVRLVSLREPSLRHMPWVGLLAALTPLVRPEMAILVGTYALVVLLQRRWQLLLWVLLGATMALLYYGWVHVATGSFSASSYCRSFALRELTELRIAGVAFHLSLLAELLRSGLLFVGAAAAVGAYFRRGQWRDPWWQFAVVSVVAYALFFTLIAPVNTVRYLAPVAFIAGSLALWGIERLGSVGKYGAYGLIALVVLSLVPVRGMNGAEAMSLSWLQSGSVLRSSTPLPSLARLC